MSSRGEGIDVEVLKEVLERVRSVEKAIALSYLSNIFNLYLRIGIAIIVATIVSFILRVVIPSLTHLTLTIFIIWIFTGIYIILTLFRSYDYYVSLARNFLGINYEMSRKSLITLLLITLLFFGLIAITSSLLLPLLEHLDTSIAVSIAISLSITILLLNKMFNPFGVKGSPLISALAFMCLAVVLITLRTVLAIDNLIPWLSLFVVTITSMTYMTYDVQRRARLCLKLR